MQRDYYDVLGVDRNASPDAIKKAFRRKARELHPDVNNASDAHERFQEVNEAYQVLSDSQKRAAYDRFGHAGVDTNGMGGFGFSDFGNFEDLFSDIFTVFTGGSRGARRSGPRQGRDLRYDLHLEFEQAIFGDEIDITVTRYEACDTCLGSGAEPGTSPVTCPECDGRGQIRQPRQTFLGSIINVMECPRCKGRGEVVEHACHTCHGTGKERQERTLTVNVPPGVDDGLQIRLSGEGDVGENGGPPGNLYVVLSVEPHEFFQRRGHDIILDMPINIAQATLGDTITVPMVDGDERIDIPAGTQTGTVVKLRGKGVPKLRRDGSTAGRGDQLVILSVDIPTKLTDQQRELFEALAETLGTELKPQKAGKGFFDRVSDFFSGTD
jgi:molecular chaperone DnaJ